MPYPTQSGIVAVLLVIAIAVMFWRLAARGPSRMSRALYAIGAVVLCLWLIGVVVQIVADSGGTR
jgi:hypothetical protein